MSQVEKIWQDWLESKSEGTQKKYEYYLNLFCKRFGFTLTELYEQRVRDIESTNRLDRLNVERLIKKHMKERREGIYPWGKGKNKDEPYGISASTDFSKAVKAFFEALDPTLRLNLKAEDYPRGSARGQDAISVDEIRQLYDSVGHEMKLRNRALLMFAKDSGLRVSDIIRLNVGDYESAQEVREGNEAFKVFKSFETKKTKEWAYTHIGPEAVKTVDDYLTERRELEGRLSKTAPLFVDRYGKRFKQSAISGIYIRLREKLPVKGRRISAHSFRKFFQTSLESAGVPTYWILKLMGKSASTYSRPEDLSPTALTDKYMDAYESLRIFKEGEIDYQARSEVEQLREQLTKQAEAIKDLQKRRATDLGLISELQGSPLAEFLRMLALLESSKDGGKKFAKAFKDTGFMDDFKKALETPRPEDEPVIIMDGMVGKTKDGKRYSRVGFSFPKPGAPTHDLIEEARKDRQKKNEKPE